MTVQIKPVTTKKDIKQFVNLQFRLYKGNKYWVPPIKSDEYHYLDPKHNPALRKFKNKFFLAIKNGQVVGRVGAAINHLYNEKTGKKYVRILKIEFIDDPEVFDALIKAVEDFGRQHGMELIHGPLGFTNLDNQGLLIEGFDRLQPVASVYHHPYYKQHFERLGFEKEEDWIEMRITITEDEVKRAERLVPLVMKRFKLEELPITNMKEAKDKYADTLFEILNEAFADLTYVVPFDQELRQYYINKYFSVLNPKYIKVLLKNGELAAFSLAMPSLSKALQKARGHLFPFGFIHIMRALKKNDTLELLLTGVRHKYRTMGLGAIVIAMQQNTLWYNGGRYFETTGMLESNKAVLANWKQYKVKEQHRRRRCYVKPISKA